MNILSRRWSERVKSYAHHFSYDHESLKGSGFSFDCKEDGTILPMHPSAQKNYQACLTGSMVCLLDPEYISVDGEYKVKPGTGRTETVKVIDDGIRTSEHFMTHHAVGECECGQHVTLSGFTNTCDKCERDYNMSGQLLADRSQWGEETGESLSDILSVDSDYSDW